MGRTWYRETWKGTLGRIGEDNSQGKRERRKVMFPQVGHRKMTGWTSIYGKKEIV